MQVNGFGQVAPLAQVRVQYDPEHERVAVPPDGCGQVPVPVHVCVQWWKLGWHVPDVHSEPDWQRPYIGSSAIRG